LNARAVPPAIFAPTNIDHVVGHKVTETGVRENRIAFGNTLGLKVQMAVEFERRHGN
jgi:hypothetical protein